MVVIAAIFHATWNGLAKRTDDPLTRLAISTATSTIISFFFLFHLPIPESSSWPFLLGSIITHQLYYIGVSLGYKLGDLSQVYPIQRGMAPLLIALGAYFFASEALSILGTLGILTISLSIVGLTLIKRKEEANRHATICALFTGTMIASYTIFDGLGGRLSGNIFSYIAWLFFLDGIPFSLTVFFINRRTIHHRIKKEIAGGLGIGILGGTAYAITIWALTYAPMAYVSALRETSVVIAVWIGCRILKEPFGSKRMIAAIFITFGVALLHMS